MKNVLINSILLIVSIFLSIIILESGLRYHYKSNRVIPSAQDFAIYDSLGIKNHHIREFTNHTGEKRNPEKYYYSSYLFGHHHWIGLYDQSLQLEKKGINVRR